MSRSLLILVSDTIKQKAKRWIDAADYGTSVEFREAKRSNEQNAKMWAMLTDFSKQVLHRGERYPPEDWKLLFLWALGQELRFIPALDGASFVPVGLQSSRLSKSEMSDLLELIASEGAKRGVIFHDQRYETGADDEGSPPTPNKEAGTNPPVLQLQHSTRAIRAITKEPIS